MENQWGEQTWLENNHDRAKRWASRHGMGRYQVPQHGGHLSAQIFEPKMQLALPEIARLQLRLCFNSIITTDPSLFLDLPPLLLIAELNYPSSCRASKTAKGKKQICFRGICISGRLYAAALQPMTAPRLPPVSSGRCGWRCWRHWGSISIISQQGQQFTKMITKGKQGDK